MLCLVFQTWDGLLPNVYFRWRPERRDIRLTWDIRNCCLALRVSARLKLILLLQMRFKTWVSLTVACFMLLYFPLDDMSFPQFMTGLNRDVVIRFNRNWATFVVFRSGYYSVWTFRALSQDVPPSHLRWISIQGLRCLLEARLRKLRLYFWQAALSVDSLN